MQPSHARRGLKRNRIWEFRHEKFLRGKWDLVQEIRLGGAEPDPPSEYPSLDTNVYSGSQSIKVSCLLYLTGAEEAERWHDRSPRRPLLILFD